MRIWLTLASISLLTLGCSSVSSSADTGRDSTTDAATPYVPDAGDAGSPDAALGPCADEGRIDCDAPGETLCCHGQLHTFHTGICGSGEGWDAGPRPDANYPDAGSACVRDPFAIGRPCTAGEDAGAEVCNFGHAEACTDGTWQFSGYVCAGFCDAAFP